MLIRKSLLAAAIVLPVVGHAETYDARTFARGGTGLTMGEYNQSLLNPALINKFDDNDDFSFALNAGALADDQQGFVDAAEEIRDDIRALYGKGSAAAAEINQRMQGFDKATGEVDVGAAILVAIPNKTVPLAVMARSKVRVGIKYSYDAADAAVLDDIANSVPGVTDEDLQSIAYTSGVGITEAGLVLGHSFGKLETGATVKIQQIDLFEYSANVATFDEDEATEDDRSVSETAFNVDLGANLRLGDEGQFVIAGVVENLIPKSFTGPVPQLGGAAAEYEMKPVVTVAAGYGNSLVKVEVNADLTARSGFDKLEESQFLRAGVELSAGRHFHLRAGYRTDTKDTLSDLVTAGIGITPFDRFNIDLSAAKGKGESMGAALQIGFKI
ncbi:MAG: conjugal transfer protein TraF [Pedobacter sp.]|nr:conjugal transfer protein TraF [Pedobacter sp.]